MAQPADARAMSPGRVFLAAVYAILLLLVAGYLGNALWNTLHLSRVDGPDVLAAVTLPAPLVGSAVPQWAEVASATGFVALVILALVMARAANRREKKPFAVADPADIFIGSMPRDQPRSSLLRPSPPNPLP
jgi:hypothetical protein